MRSSTDGVDWAAFFKEHEDYTVAAGFYENRRDFSVEQLYQAFKARMKFEEESGY